MADQTNTAPEAVVDKPATDPQIEFVALLSSANSRTQDTPPRDASADKSDAAVPRGFGQVGADKQDGSLYFAAADSPKEVQQQKPGDKQTDKPLAAAAKPDAPLKMEGPEVGLGKGKDGTTIVRVKDQNGKPSWTGRFDKDGKLTGYEVTEGATTKSFDGKGNLIETALKDKGGRVIESTNAKGDVTNSLYDSNGNLSMKMTTDKQGRLQSFTDASGKTSEFTYNSGGLIQAISNDPSGKPSRFDSVDKDGKKAGSMSFDGRGNVVGLETDRVKFDAQLTITNKVSYTEVKSGLSTPLLTANGFEKGGIRKTVSADTTESEQQALSRHTFNLAGERIMNNFGAHTEHKLGGADYQSNQAYLAMMYSEAKKLSSDPKQMVMDSLSRHAGDSPIKLTPGDASKNTPGLWEKGWTDGTLQIRNMNLKWGHVYGLPK